MPDRAIDQEAMLIDRLKSFNENLKFLHQISQKLSQKKSLPVLLEEIMQSSKALIRAEASSLLLKSQSEEKLNFYVTTGEKGEMFKQFSLEMGEGIAGWVAENRQTVVIDDCYADPRFNQDYDRKSGFRTRCMICVPMLREEALIGVIQVINKSDGSLFSEEDRFLMETLASQCAIAIENHHLTEKQIASEIIENELRRAREIQQNILPETLPTFLDLDVANLLVPAKEVGGDYYNIYRINDDQSLFFIADVSGKSISAALIVSNIDACLNSYMKINRSHFDLMELVSIMNEVLIESTTLTTFATGWFGLYNHRTGELHSVNAGHNYPYICCHSDDAIMELKTGGPPLGGVKVPFKSELITLNQGGMLIYFTDGITEAENQNGDMFEEDRLIDVIERNRSGNAREVLAAIQADVMKHVNGAEQSDDMACVVIKRKAV